MTLLLDATTKVKGRVVKVQPDGTYRFKWYEASTGGGPLKAWYVGRAPASRLSRKKEQGVGRVSVREGGPARRRGGGGSVEEWGALAGSGLGLVGPLCPSPPRPAPPSPLHL